MKLEGLLFAIATVFFGVVAIVYWFLSYEVIGTTALALTGALSFLISFYMLYTARRVGYRPEDRKDALISDADPDYGFFSPTSWWPLPVALSTATVALGFVFAIWIVILGVGLLMVSLVGFFFEYYRGAWAEWGPSPSGNSGPRQFAPPPPCVVSAGPATVWRGRRDPIRMRSGRHSSQVTV